MTLRKWWYFEEEETERGEAREETRAGLWFGADSLAEG